MSQAAHASITSTPGVTGGAVPRTEDGEGIKLGPRSTFHPGFALMVGGDSNVFWNRRGDVGGIRPAGVLMPVAWLGIGNREVRDNILQSEPEAAYDRWVDYNLRLTAGYRAFVARAEDIRKLPRFTVDVNGHLTFAPGRRFSVSITEFFSRFADPRNYDAGIGYNYNRIDHRLAAGFVIRPGGGRLSLGASYLNELLYFEAQDVYNGDRYVHGVATELKWRIAPRSAILATYSFHHTYYMSCNANIDPDCNEDNNAHRVLLGFRGQVARRVTLDALVGYGAGLYYDDENGPNFGGFIGGVRAAYYPTLRTQLFAQLDRTFSDSLYGNFFTDLAARLGALHTFRWRMYAELNLGVAGRRYHGLPIPGRESRIERYENAPDNVRSDTLVILGARVEQPLGRFFVVGARYDLTVDRTDFVAHYPGGLVDYGGFAKHVAMAIGAVRF
ncbi:MAG TPA: hypothetical protein VIK91_03870 [Nannocystis sp.]